MYFESRKNVIKNLTKAPIEKQLESIRNLSIGTAVKIGNIIWVNDQNPSGTGIHEVAVIYEKDKSYFKFESITISWCKDKDIVDFLNDYSKLDYLQKEYNIDEIEPVNFNDENTKTYFNCGCCGASFQSTIKKQKKYDQDAGFGFCKSCEPKTVC